MKLKFTFLAALAIAISSCNSPASDSSNSDDKTPAKEAPVEKPVEPKLIPPAEPDTLKGIDVSHFNGDVNWKEVHAKGYTYAYAKATQGKEFVDPHFNLNWKGINESGMKRGAYHFYVASDDADAQSDIFLKTVGEWDANKDIPPVLDLEGTSIDGVELATYQKNVLSWLKAVEAKLGVQPIIYTNHPFGNSYLNTPEFGKYKLWIADYNPAPAIPDAWKSTGWYMWQHESRGDVTGVNGNVDEDLLVQKK